MMEVKTIFETIEKPISGEWGIEPSNGPVIKVIRNTNFSNDGSLNLKNVVEREISISKISQKKLRYGDILIEKSGGSPNQPVGRVVFFDQTEGEYLFSNFTSSLRPRKGIFPKYLFYLLYGNHLFKKTLSFQNKTTGILNLQLERYLKESKIPMPSLPEQERIATNLDLAYIIRRKNRQILEKYNELAKSVFYEMLGDPQTNNKNWNVLTLGELADDIRYGTNSKSFGESENNLIPVLRIPNVAGGEVNFKDLKYCNIERSEYEKIKLKPGDLLFVRSNGNPDYIGRCAVFNSNSDFVYASYIIRVRLIRESPISPNILSFILNFPSYRSRVLREARTTAGNYNLNTEGLKSFEIIIPSKDLQNRFSEIMQNIENQKIIAGKSLEKSEELFQSLLQRAFKGEL